MPNLVFDKSQLLLLHDKLHRMFQTIHVHLHNVLGGITLNASVLSVKRSIHIVLCAGIRILGIKILAIEHRILVCD